MIRALTWLPLARVLRPWRTRLTVIAWCVLAIVLAVAARSNGSLRAADHALLGCYGPLVLPLLAYTLVGAIVGGQSLSSSTAPLVTLGARPTRVSAVAILVAAAACAVAGSIVAAVVAMLAHGTGDPPLVRDTIVSAYAGGLGGTAYGTWFMLGASLGKRGGGRPVLLVVDWLLGATDGAASLATPRGHVRNLLGGTAPMDLSQRASAGVLVVLALVCAFIVVKRAR
ncbi:MAG: hypothetical protein M3O46_11415 [Myxococcota bacterium]|nr:hypothetical protein [Myxococcota bacterium]